MALRPALVLLGIATTSLIAGGLARSLTANDQPNPQSTSAQNKSEQKTEDPTFNTKTLPFLQKYCLDCHNAKKASGGLTLEGYMNEGHARKDRKTWATVEHVLAASEMPPPKRKIQP